MIAILEHSSPAVRITSAPGRSTRGGARSAPPHAGDATKKAEPASEPAPPVASAPQPPVEVKPVPKPATGEVDPNGGNRPRRTIDPANPYGGDE
jgi:hypothetical protein